MSNDKKEEVKEIIMDMFTNTSDDFSVDFYIKKIISLFPTQGTCKNCVAYGDCDIAAELFNAPGKTDITKDYCSKFDPYE